MSEKTYNNSLNEVEISLGIERLLIADYPASWTPARINLASLPSGFYDLGAVDEGTPELKVTRSKFQLETGLPKTVQYQTITGLKGSFSATLHSNSWRKLQIALGNYSAVSSATMIANISSVTSDGLTFTLSSTPSTPLLAGAQIIVAASGTQDAIDGLECRIGSVTANGLTYTVSTQPYALKSITTGHGVYVYGYVKQVIGGRSIRTFSLLGVTDFIDNSQVVHFLRKVQSADDFMEKFTPDANGKIPLTLDAMGFSTTIGSCTEVVLGERYYFPSGPGSC